ncbi:MAG TPA: ATP-binding protein [Pyrinomonadaceae bacterium]|nr:ATP-binding protein [Pyrinomonadaceae bacterium]
MKTENGRKQGLKAVPSGKVAVNPQELPTLADNEVCSKCFGTGLEVVDGLGARTCECRKKDAHSLRLVRARIPKRYEKCHFNTFNPKNPSLRDALRFAQDFTQLFPAVDQALLLSGPVGVGKTHLAVSMIKGLSERGFQCLFYEFGSLLKEIQDSYNPNTKTSELTVLTPVLTADLLVLDELGASKPTDWVRDTLSHIINTRYNEDRFTIFTTNYLDDRLTEASETLEDRIGVRARSRLFEMCRTVRMEGEDHRRSIGRAIAR